MSKVTMPEPIYEIGDYPSNGEVMCDCYSLEQMEAYAASKVREALDQAAAICDEWALMNEQAVSDDEPDETSSLRAAAWQITVIGQRIRALIP